MNYFDIRKQGPLDGKGLEALVASKLRIQVVCYFDRKFPLKGVLSAVCFDHVSCLAALTRLQWESTNYIYMTTKLLSYNWNYFRSKIFSIKLYIFLMHFERKYNCSRWRYSMKERFSAHRRIRPPKMYPRSAVILLFLDLLESRH